VQAQDYDAIPPLLTAGNAEFARLAQTIRESSEAHADRAHDAQMIALFGRLTIFLSSGAILGTLYWRYRRVRGEAELAAAEQEALRRSEARFQPLVEQSSDIIAVIDAGGMVTYVSPSVERIAGIRPDEVVGHHMFAHVPEPDRAQIDEFFRRVHQRPRETLTTEMEFTSRLGRRCLELVCTNRLDDEDVRGIVLNARDVSERKRLEDQLRFQAFHDALTGLANSSLFNDRLEHALLRAKRSGRGEISVIYMDLDRFKEVNDEFGHQAGDQLLRQVAARLQTCIRASDTAARLGGDEFAILIEDAGSNNKASEVASRVYNAMAEPFAVEERGVQVSASIGVIVAEPETMSAGDVLRNADLAMYDAKHHGRNRVHHFKPAMLLALSDLDAMAGEGTPSGERPKAAA
jgi:diguanylate cyclase (GGDEF)-like protein/PAS domain S-box-containing protein